MNKSYFSLLILALLFSSGYSICPLTNPNTFTPAFSTEIGGLDFSPDGNHLIVSSYNNGSVIVYQYSSGTVTNPVQYYPPSTNTPFPDKCNFAIGTKFSRNGLYLFIKCLNGFAVMGWNSLTGVLTPINFYNSVSFPDSIDTSLNDSILVVGQSNFINTFSFNTSSGNVTTLNTYTIGSSVSNLMVTFSSNDQYVYAGVSFFTSRDCEIIRYIHSNGVLNNPVSYPCPPISIINNSIYTLMLSPNKNFLIGSSINDIFSYQIMTDGSLTNLQVYDATGAYEISFNTDATALVTANIIGSSVTSFNYLDFNGTAGCPTNSNSQLSSSQYIRYDKTGSYVYLAGFRGISISRLSVQPCTNCNFSSSNSGTVSSTGSLSSSASSVAILEHWF